jgi:glutaredoxin
MNQSQKTLAVILGSVVIVVGGLIWLSQPRPTPPGQNDSLAQCLTDKGVKFYGAYWCPHCAAQKAAIGESSMKLINYVECGVQGDTQAQTDACKSAGVNTYPTWIFADGTRLVGEQTMEALADKAGCPKPASTSAAATTAATTTK